MKRTRDIIYIGCLKIVQNDALFYVSRNFKLVYTLGVHKIFHRNDIQFNTVTSFGQMSYAQHIARLTFIGSIMFCTKINI